MFFISVASKGVSFSVSLLFATLAGRFISVAFKGLTVVRESERRGVRALETGPLPTLFLERYDSVGVIGWGSANDMIP
jgi:hypothetical protein